MLHCWKSHVVSQFYLGKHSHEILVLIVKTLFKNKHAQLLSETIDPNFTLSLHHLPYFVYVSREGSGETVQMRRFILAVATCRCDKYKNLMYWPISSSLMSHTVHTVKPV